MTIFCPEVEFVFLFDKSLIVKFPILRFCPYHSTYLVSYELSISSMYYTK